VEPIKMSFTSFEMPYGLDQDKAKEVPVLIMHGLFGSKSNWSSMSKALHNMCKQKIITVDARNHGESPHSPEFSYHHLASDILYLMSELNIEKVSVLGHSMGGRAMMLFALAYPEIVHSLIVVDISPFQVANPSMLKMKVFFDALKSVTFDHTMTMSQARKAADEQLSLWIPDVGVRQFLLTNLTKNENAKFKWRVNLEVLSKSFSSEIMNFPDVTGVFNKPTLFIGGSKSDYLPMEHHDKIRKLFPRAEFRYLEAGHWVHAEQPHEFLILTCDFLENTKNS